MIVFVSLECSEETLSTAKFLCVEEANKISNAALLPRKREINADMGGTVLLRKVTSIESEVDARFDTAWKAAAVLQKGLIKMVGEELVAPSYKFAFDLGKVHATLCVRPAAARKEWERLFKEDAPTTGDAVMKLARLHQANLRMLDDKWAVEHAVVENLAGDGSEERLARQMLEQFPTQDEDVSVEQALLHLNTMKTSDKYKFASRTAHAKHGFVVKILGRLADGEPPVLDIHAEDPTMQIAITQLGFFVRHEEAGGAGAKGPVTTGVDALVKKLTAAQVKSEGGTALANADVSDLKAYEHLLPDDVKAQAKLLVDSVAAPVDLSKKGLPNKKGAAKGKADKAMEEAMSMFGLV